MTTFHDSSNQRSEAHRVMRETGRCPLCTHRALRRRAPAPGYGDTYPGPTSEGAQHVDELGADDARTRRRLLR